MKVRGQAKEFKRVVESVRNFTSRTAVLGDKAVYVGLPAGRIHQPSGLPLAQLGAIHEFGHGRIPERSFLRGYMRTHTREVRRQLQGAGRAVVNGANAETTLERLALWAQGEVQAFIANGRANFVPLAPATIAQRRNNSTNPLNDTGALRQGITGVVGDADAPP